MRMRHYAAGLVLAGVFTGSCSTGSIATTEALLTTTAGPSATSTTPQPGAGSSLPPLVEPGCERFDAAELGKLSPLGVPLRLIQSDSSPTTLACNFVAAADSLDTGVRITVESVAELPDGHFTEPAGFESPITIGDRLGVATGRGNLRFELDDKLGLTLEVTIRTLGSDATIPRDGEFIEIRDKIAAYLITQLDG